MNDQAANWAGRELNLHWGFDELRADRAIHPMDLQEVPKATCVALANSRWVGSLQRDETTPEQFNPDLLLKPADFS